MFFYHIHLMIHFLDGNEINLPYFLLNSLRKMSRNVQKKIQFIETTMYHHGLIKMIIGFHLKGLGDDCENFLIRNHFRKKKKNKPIVVKEKEGEKEYLKALFKSYLNNSPKNNQRMKFLLKFFYEASKSKQFEEINSTEKKKTHPRRERRSK